MVLQGAVGDSFEEDTYKFIVLSEEGDQGRVSIGSRGIRFPKEVTLPATIARNNITYSVVEIREQGFIRSGRIEFLKIPATITHIGDFAFFDCFGLKQVEIPQGVTRLGRYSFYECRSLTSIEIPDSVKSIGDQAFYGCINLAKVILPDTLALGNDVFDNCYNLPSPLLSTTGKTLFTFSSLSTLNRFTIPETVTTIAPRAFATCRNLQGVKIPPSVTRIGEQAFMDCPSLEGIQIPQATREIGSEAFKNCDSLKEINVEEGNPVFSSKEGLLLNQDGTHLLSFPCGKFGNYRIPDTITQIDPYAFWDCHNLTSLEVPSSVTMIASRAFAGCTSLTNLVLEEGVKRIDSEALWNCIHLEQITLPESLTQVGSLVFRTCMSLRTIEVKEGNPLYSSKGGVLFNKDQSSLVCCPPGLNGEFIIPEGVREIGHGAFIDCNKLTSVELPDSLIRIHNVAFWGCLWLKRIVIPKGVTEIEPEDAFFDCRYLTHLYFEGNPPSGGIGYLAPGASMYYLRGTTGWKDKWSGHPTVALEPNQIVLYPHQEQQTVPEGFRCTLEIKGFNLDQFSFQWYAQGKPLAGETRPRLLIPSAQKSDAGHYSVEVSNRLGEKETRDFTLDVGRRGDPDEDFKYVFENNEVRITRYLKKNPVVEIPNLIGNCPVTRINERAFWNCPGIRKVKIPKGVYGIKPEAFSGCRDLEEVELPEGMTWIDPKAFSYCLKLKSIHIPDTVTYIGGSVFRGCPRLEEITVDEGSVHFSSKEGVLFNKMQNQLLCCPAAKKGEYTVPNGVRRIGIRAFEGCSDLRSIIIPESVTLIDGEAFYSCSALSKVTLGKGLQRIERQAFEGCSSLSQITIPEKVKFIGYEAFYYCYNLRHVILCSSSLEFSDYVFENCSNLVDIYFEGDAPQGGLDVFGRKPREKMKIYYLPGTNGWGERLYGVRTQMRE